MTVSAGSCRVPRVQTLNPGGSPADAQTERARQQQMQQPLPAITAAGQLGCRLHPTRRSAAAARQALLLLQVSSAGRLLAASSSSNEGVAARRADPGTLMLMSQQISRVIHITKAGAMRRAAVA